MGGFKPRLRGCRLAVEALVAVVRRLRLHPSSMQRAIKRVVNIFDSSQQSEKANLHCLGLVRIMPTACANKRSMFRSSFADHQ